MKNNVLEKWHKIALSGDPAGLDEILAEKAVFHSPVVHSPQVGKAITSMYLGAAIGVFSGSEFRYVREVVGERDAVLEFTATIDGIHLNGVDMIHWDESGRIDDFKVMIRPLKAVNLLHRMMGQMLEQLSPKH